MDKNSDEWVDYILSQPTVEELEEKRRKKASRSKIADLAEGEFDSLTELKGDCLLWTGPFRSNSPVHVVDNRYYGVRREKWVRDEMGEIPPGGVITRNCNEERCVAPEHYVCLASEEFNLLRKTRARAKKDAFKVQPRNPKATRTSNEKPISDSDAISALITYLESLGYTVTKKGG